MIDELGMIKPAIISCGGGMALRELNVRKLQAIGTVVLLTAKPETIFERVRYNTNRPLLKDNMNVDYIRQMMEKRRVYYEHAATVSGKKAVNQFLCMHSAGLEHFMKNLVFVDMELKMRTKAVHTAG